MTGSVGTAGAGAGTAGARRRGGPSRSGDRDGAEQAGDAARQAKRAPLVRRLARASIAARGAVYLVLAYLTARLAAGDPTGHSADSRGALTVLVHTPGGQALVSALAVGFVAYAGWRFLQAVAGDATAEGGTEALKRVGWAAIGVAYLALAAEAVEAVVEGHAGGRSPTSEAARILGLPGGRIWLFALGLGILVGGIGLAVWAVLQRFEAALPEGAQPGWARPLVRVAGTFGNLTRGAVFAAVGVTLAAAAVVGRAHDAKGLGSALASFAGLAGGKPVLWVVAAGFATFAGLSVVEAVYRRL